MTNNSSKELVHIYTGLEETHSYEDYRATPLPSALKRLTYINITYFNEISKSSAAFQDGTNLA
jgi:hypothetical protein